MKYYFRKCPTVFEIFVNFVIRKLLRIQYHYQVQGQLTITQLPWCDILIWTPHGTSLQRIKRDEDLMYLKLKLFYHEYLLPELADPVYYSGQSIRHLQLPS